MDRKAARQLARSVIEATDGYALICDGPPDKFAKKSPVCVITSKSIGVTFDARDEWTIESAILVSIYVQRVSGKEDAAEDQLDDLVRQAVLALLATGEFSIDRSDAFAENAPLRDIDGVLYRVERIPLRVAEDYEDYEE